MFLLAEVVPLGTIDIGIERSSMGGATESTPNETEEIGSKN